MSLVQTWMRVWNWLLLCQGLVIAGGATYIAVKAMSPFVYILYGVAVYVIFLSIVGLRMVARRREGCVSLYAVCFFLLLALHTVIACGFLFAEDKTVSVLQDLNSRGDNESVRDYFDEHRDAFKWAAVAVLSVEFLSFCVAVCCAERVSANEDASYSELETVLMDGNQQGLVSSPAHYADISATPQTDARRAEMAEKYGDRFSKRY